MGWQEARQAYQGLGRQNDQTDENLLGTRIITGLGFTQPTKMIGRLEQGLFGARNDDAPRFDRAVAVFKHAMTLAAPSRRHLAVRWRMMALASPSVNKLYDSVYDQIQLTTAYKNGEWPLIFTRCSRRKVCHVFTTWWANELTELTPPFDVLPLDGTGEYRLVRQEVTAFVQQLGPYDFGNIHQVCGNWREQRETDT